VNIYTDDKGALLDHAKEIGQRQSAIELVGKGKVHESIVRQLEHEKQNPLRRTQKEISKTKEREDYEPDIQV
jgi:hypothetical protein